MPQGDNRSGDLQRKNASTYIHSIGHTDMDLIENSNRSHVGQLNAHGEALKQGRWEGLEVPQGGSRSGDPQ